MKRILEDERIVISVEEYVAFCTDFWEDPIVSEKMTAEDKYFYLYLYTNPDTNQIGIYQISKKQMAFELGYRLERVETLMDRFIQHYQLIRYNPETRELAIRDWGKYHLHEGEEPDIDCLISELEEVEDLSLIQYVSENIQNPEIRSQYESISEQEEVFSAKDDSDLDENDGDGI